MASINFHSSADFVLDPGLLSSEVTVESATMTRDDMNHPVPSWSTFFNWRAHIIWKSGKEEVEGGKETIFNDVEMTGRYITGLTEKMRLDFDGDKYDILLIQQIGGARKRYHKITARKNN